MLTAVRENLRRGASQIKVMASGGISSEYDPIDVTQFTLDEMKAAVQAVGDWGTYVAPCLYRKFRKTSHQSGGKKHRTRPSFR